MNDKKEKIKKPFYKKWWFIVIVIIVVINVFSSIGDKKDSGQVNSSNTPATESTEQAISGNNPEPEKNAEIEGEGDIGKYHVAIKDFELITEGYGNEPAVLITYEWTNNSDESKAFWIVFDAKVFQNGIECEAPIIKVDGDNDNDGKDIKPGVTLEVKKGYILNDIETDIEVEIAASFSLSKNSPKVSRIFEISH